ncbi:MAG: hypothetical protein GX096_03880 [Clostridiales bacterium]|nr:hypothetical protein [Clostridiales bacterium]
MGKARFMMQSSRSCFRKWKNAPRMLTLLGMIACITIIYAVPFAENAKAQGETLQCAEIFIAMMNWRFSMLLLSTAILLLFGDLPVIEPFTSNALIRGTRRGWMASQILYVAITAFALTAFIFVMTLVVAMPNMNVSNAWSRPVKLLTSSGRIAIAPERMKLPLPPSIVADYLPWQAFGHSFALFFLLGCFYGLASLTLRMKFRSASFVLLMIINVISWATGMLPHESFGYALLSILSVHYHTSLYKHEMVTVNAMLPSLGASYAVLLCAVLAIGVVALALVKKYDYIQMEVEQP